jgi:hypothetical protein
VDRVADAHPAGAVEPARPPQHRDALARRPGGLAAVVVVGHDEVAPGERRRRIDRSGDRLAGPGRLASRLQRLAGAHERLGRDAAPVGALAAEQLALDDRHPQPALGQPRGAVLAGRPAAEDDDVEFAAHASPLALSISYAAVISPMWL